MKNKLSNEMDPIIIQPTQTIILQSLANKYSLGFIKLKTNACP